MSSFAKFFSQKRGQVRGQRKAIEEVLKVSPATVTKISEETEFAKNLVVWNLMGMLRWSEVEIKGEENHELIYSLKEV